MSRSTRVFVVALVFFSSAWADQGPANRDGISLVYWGSKDCQWCTYWESSLSGFESDFRLSALFPKITYIPVKNLRIRDAYVETDFPSSAQWLWISVRDGAVRPTSLRPGWSLFVGRKHLRSYIGARTWKDGVLPALERLVLARGESADSFERVISTFGPQSSKSRVDDVDAVPYVGSGGRDAYIKWLQGKVPKAFAVGFDGSYGYAKEAADALVYCNRYSSEACELYAVDNQVVWSQKNELPN